MPDDGHMLYRCERAGPDADEVMAERNPLLDDGWELAILLEAKLSKSGLAKQADQTEKDPLPLRANASSCSDLTVATHSWTADCRACRHTDLFVCQHLFIRRMGETKDVP